MQPYLHNPVCRTRLAETASTPAYLIILIRLYNDKLPAPDTVGKKKKIFICRVYQREGSLIRVNAWRATTRARPFIDRRVTSIHRRPATSEADAGKFFKGAGGPILTR